MGLSEIKILQIGMGPLGVRISQFIEERNGLTTIAAVDKNPELVGRDFGPHTDTQARGIKIMNSVAEAVSGKMPDIAVLTTVSDMERITPQIEEIVSFGIPVVSTCEELSYSFECAPELSRRINEAAIANGVAVLGTGVNPGFLMDSLPVTLTAICQRVDSIAVNRFQNASFRRLPFQKKIGAGLSLQSFREKVENRTLRHVGLTESIQMIASRMKWKLEKVEDIITPVIAEEAIKTSAMMIARGEAAGVRQVGRGYVDGEARITLTFQATVGEPETFDEVIIRGNPDLVSRIQGGVNGDVATCAIILNSIPQVLRSSPGLKTMLDIPPVSYFGGRSAPEKHRL